MRVNPEIFRAYDIRGDFPDKIDGKVAYTIARAFIQVLSGGNSGEELRIVVAHDARPSSPELIKGVIAALMEEGATILDMGFATSPFHYFAIVHENAGGGIMVTASHDPCRMNGLKLSLKGAEPLGERMEMIKNIARRGIFTHTPKPSGKLEKLELGHKYIDFIIKQVDVSSLEKLNVVVDVGGGMSGMVLRHIIKRIPLQIHLLHTDPFCDPMRDPLNPAREIYLAELKNTVLEKHADFGVAFDSDGDRSGFVTNNARFFRADLVGAFFAREFLKVHPGEAIVHDIRSSSIFRETITASGGRPLESRVGHSFMKSLMRRENAFFGAELSGHFYFRDFFYADSDVLPFLYFAKMLGASRKSADELLDEFLVYPSTGEIDVKQIGDEHIFDKIASHFSDAKEIKWIDGVSIYYDDWWANIRSSNTESFVRLNVEARTHELLKEKLEEIRAFLGQ